MRKYIRVGLAQVNTIVGDLDGNQRKISEYIARARQVSCDIVVFPELALVGYPPEDLLLKKHFIGANLAAIKALAKSVSRIVAVVGFVDRDAKGVLYNAAAIIAEKKIKGVYRKNHLPNYGVFDEKRYFSCGQDIMTFQYDGVNVGVSICEDIWQPSGYCARHKKAGTDLLLNLSASPYHCNKAKERKDILTACARQSHASVCYCNLVGGQDELVFDGGSLVVDSRGKILAGAQAFAEDLLVVDVGLPAGRVNKKGIVIHGARPLGEKRILISGKKPQKISREEEIYHALVLGTRDYVRKNGFHKAVIGLSGGIDSALVAAIAKEALGQENVLGVSMPSRYTSPETRRDAKQLAENLNISFQEIPIDEIFASYLKTLQPVFQQAPVNIAEENLQARIRGNLLMALSNKLGHLVLTTGNKSEIAVGYCTLYGDMAGGFAVIKDVPKTVVYRLAHFVNQNDKSAPIPESIIMRAPTAELKENQKDQDTLPPYETLDKILYGYVEQDQSLSQLKRVEQSMSLIQKVVQLVDRMEYKRRQAPLGVKITPKAFGRDRRLPITNKYREE